MRRSHQTGRWPHAEAASGFSLLEVLMAVALLAGALVALAQLCAIATSANVVARGTTVAVVLATAKIEQLRQDVAHAAGGSLESDLAGFSDAFDAGGRSLGVGLPPPQGAAFVRRWSVQPLASDPVRSRLCQVRVLRRSTLASGPRWPGMHQGESRLLTLATQTDR